MFLLCAGDSAFFDKDALRADVASYLSIEQAQVAVTITAGSVLADVKMTSTEDGADAIYDSLVSLDATAASAAFNVPVVDIAVTVPAVAAAAFPSPPPQFTPEESALATSKSGSGINLTAIAVIVVGVLFCGCGCVCLLVARKRLGAGKASRPNSRPWWDKRGRATSGLIDDSPRLQLRGPGSVRRSYQSGKI